MNLEERLRELKRASKAAGRDAELETQLAVLRRMSAGRPLLPAERAAKGIEEYVEGSVATNAAGCCFEARQALPFGRPYGKLRIGDLASADLAPLEIFAWSSGARIPDPAKILYLDTETTGLAGGTGTCAFLVGLGRVVGPRFLIRQLFLRDYPEEKAMLRALAEAVEDCEAVATFNGKTFDIPLLETRLRLARMKSPFKTRLHLDLLHPARRIWKLRLENCALSNLEAAVLGVSREGDVPGSEIPAIYFDYLRTGDARGLQPVFYHNALDVLSLAGLAVGLAGLVRRADGGPAGPDCPEDLFSLSRIFGRAGKRDLALSTCARAIERGLPRALEPRALWHLAAEHKRGRRFDAAVELWAGLARRETPFAVSALEQLAIHYEHRARDLAAALHCAKAALDRLRDTAPASPRLQPLSHRLDRLKRKSAAPGRPLFPA